MTDLKARPALKKNDDQLARAAIDDDALVDKAIVWKCNTKLKYADEESYIEGFTAGAAHISEQMQAVMKEREEARAENKRLRFKLAEFTEGRVHTCHDECQRIECKLARENERLKAELAEARAACAVVTNEFKSVSDMAEFRMDRLDELKAKLAACEKERTEWKAKATQAIEWERSTEKQLRDQLRAERERADALAREVRNIKDLAAHNERLTYERDQARAEVARLREKYDLQLIVKREERYRLALERIAEVTGTSTEAHHIAREALNREDGE